MWVLARQWALQAHTPYRLSRLSCLADLAIAARGLPPLTPNLRARIMCRRRDHHECWCASNADAIERCAICVKGRLEAALDRAAARNSHRMASHWRLDHRQDSRAVGDLVWLRAACYSY